MEKSFALRSIDKTEKEDTDYTEINVKKLSTREPHIYQQLQLNQRSKDAIYDKISKCEQQSAAEHEL